MERNGNEAIRKRRVSRLVEKKRNGIELTRSDKEWRRKERTDMEKNCIETRGEEKEWYGRERN